MIGIEFKKNWERNVMSKNNLTKEQLSAQEKEHEKWVLNLMRDMATNQYCTVKFYPYRQAQVYDRVFEATRDSMLPLEYMLAVKAGVRPDNHTVYEILFAGCQTFYIWFTDDQCFVGKAIAKL